MIDHRIPMMGRSPNVLAALDAGTQAAGNQNALMRQYEGQNLFRQHGAQAMQGNPNALAAIAGFDPVMGLSMATTQQENRRADERLGMDREKLAMTRQQVAMAVSQEKDRRAAEAQAQEAQAAMRAAGLAFMRGDEAAFMAATEAFAEGGLPMSEEGLRYADAIVSGFSDGLSALVPQQGKDPAAELKIQRLMETGLDRNTAIGIADGRMVTTQLGELMDKATGQIIDAPSGVGSTPAPLVQVAPELPPGTRSALPAENVDYRGAFGAEGFLTSLVNGLSDFAVGVRPFEEQGRARTALTNLKTRTLTTLASASVAGRPSNYVMQMFEQNVAQPSLTGGPAGALDTAQQTMDFLDAMIAENQAVLNSRVNQETRSTARRSIEALEGLRQDYEIVVRGLSGGGVEIRPEVQDRLRAYE